MACMLARVAGRSPLEYLTSAQQQMQAQREDATRAHVAEALAMLQEWHSDRGRLARYDSVLIPLAKSRFTWSR